LVAIIKEAHLRMGVPFLFRGSSVNITFGEVSQIRMDVDGYGNFIILVQNSCPLSSNETILMNRFIDARQTPSPGWVGGVVGVSWGGR
jgi:hypothetical protein